MVTYPSTAECHHPRTDQVPVTISAASITELHHGLSVPQSPASLHLPRVIRVGVAGCMGARSHALDGDGETNLVPVLCRQDRAPQGLCGVGAPRLALTPGSWVRGGAVIRAAAGWPFPTQCTGQTPSPSLAPGYVSTPQAVDEFPGWWLGSCCFGLR